MTTTDTKKKGFALTRWQVSDRGSVAHLRVGRAPKTICGEIITMTGKPVSANAVNPPCQDCNRVLNAAAKKKDSDHE